MKLAGVATSLSWMSIELCDNYWQVSLSVNLVLVSYVLRPNPFTFLARRHAQAGHKTNFAQAIYPVFTQWDKLV